MAKIIGRDAFKRRGLELHIGKLFALRREHHDDSFFEPSGAIRGYAREYLRAWIPMWESDEAPRAARKHLSATFLGHVTERTDWENPEELLFREVLGVLQDDYPRYYLCVGDGDFSEAQVDEILDAYPLSTDVVWKEADDNLAFDNVYFFGKPIISRGEI